MNGGYMDRYDAIVGIIIMILMILGIVFIVKHEEKKYNHCKYLIVDSHKYQYHAIAYKVIDNSCISMINEDHKRVIICGQYTIEETN
jgi:glucose uptake protein GlcU